MVCLNVVKKGDLCMLHTQIVKRPPALILAFHQEHNNLCRRRVERLTRALDGASVYLRIGYLKVEAFFWTGEQ